MKKLFTTKGKTEHKGLTWGRNNCKDAPYTQILPTEDETILNSFVHLRVLCGEWFLSFFL